MSKKPRKANPPPRSNLKRGLPVALVVVVLGVLAYAGVQGSQSRPEIEPDGDIESAPDAASSDAAAEFCCEAGTGATLPTQRLPDPETANVPDAGPIEETVVQRVSAPDNPPKGMAWVPPGVFSMGSAYTPFADARPIHSVELDGFWMDKTSVTNEQFGDFVEATGYVTVAEQTPKAEDFPGVAAEQLVAGSVVFTPPDEAVPLDNVTAWWRFAPGADWRHPEGPDSDLTGREKHPVVHVCWDDAAAYARWADKRLPTEAEWEYAARGGLTQQHYVWGREFSLDGKLMANTWQGRFPNQNTKEDGWVRTSPVASFPANGFGLFDMGGNVWHWCQDWYRPDYYAASDRKNPQGPPDSFDPNEPEIPKRVQRGGSFLCCDQYCSRYMPGGRGKGAVDTGTSHVGFRCVKSAEGNKETADTREDKKGTADTRR